MTKVEKVVTEVLIAILGIYAVRPHPHIKADPIGQVCAICPKGFVNNVSWVSNKDWTVNQQWSEYVNDAGGGYCSVDWKWIFTGKRGY